MEANRYNSKLEELEDICGKFAAPKETIRDEFIEKYILLTLIPWTIYRLAVNIINFIDNEPIYEQQYSIDSIGNYANLSINLSNKIFILSLTLILCNFLVIYISSKLIFKKYKIRSNDLNYLVKVIIIIQILFVCIFSFFFYVDYNNLIARNPIFKDKFEWLLEQKQTQMSKKNDIQLDINDINMYINNVTTVQRVELAILIILEIVSAFLCTFWQYKIMKLNSK